MQQSDRVDRTHLQPREKEVAISAKSMIKRFRETKPSSRQEREEVRGQRKSQDLWWIHDEIPTGKERVSYNNAASSKKAPSRLAVDKVMSRDIQRFIATRGERAENPREPPSVVPSPSVAAVSHMLVSTSTEGYPRRRLLVDVDSDTRKVRESEATDGEDHDYQLYLRDCLELKPRVYTGSAQLRGVISPTSPKGMMHGESGPSAQYLGLVPNDDTRGGNIVSAADAVSDLDDVLRQLQNGMVAEQRERSPSKSTPQKSIPVNLSQIAHDLDAKLLEFTLMAKARQQVTEEAFEADEAEKDAWRKRETKRVEDMVRQEHAVLQNKATAGDYAASPRIKTAPEGFVDYVLAGFPENVELKGDATDAHDWNNQALKFVSTKHPALPPSALGAYARHTLDHAGAHVEAIADQMAGVLRAAEAKINRIEALRADGWRGQEGTCSMPPSSISMEPAKSDFGTIGSPSCYLKEDPQADDSATELAEDVRIHGIKEPLVSAGLQGQLAAKMDGTLKTDDHMKSEPKPPCALHTSYDHVAGGRLVPNEPRDIPKVIPEWCLGEHASLRQAGRCIETELEVAMLYMQRRLDKTSIAYGMNSTEADDTKTRAPHDNHDNVLSNIMGKSSQIPASAVDIEHSSKVSSQQSLEVLAECTFVRPDTHVELDRELGPDCRGDPDELWCENGSPIHQLRRLCRVQQDAALFKSNSDREVCGMESVHGALLPHTGLYCEERIVGASPFGTPDIAPPAHLSGDGPTSRPATPTLVQQPDAYPEEHPSHIPSSAQDAFFENTTKRHGLSLMDGNAQQPSLQRRLQQKDAGGSGYAVVRARRRLYSFRTMRRNVSTGVDVATDQHESDPRPRRSLAKQQTASKSHGTSRTLLKRLQDVRSSLTAYVPRKFQA